MNLANLATQIQQTSQIMQQSALVAVNTNLTIRNWLIGFYIFEFEQKGEDRAKYGEKLLQNLADKLNEDNFSYRNLNLFRQFFKIYPQLSDYIRKYLQLANYEQFEILQSVIAELHDEVFAIMQTPSAQLPLIPSEKLIRKLSYTHFVQLLSIEDPIKRLFYELECNKGTWSVRELNRQIKTLYYERSGLSKLREKLCNEV